MKSSIILTLVSGNGTNLQALIDAEKAGRFGHWRIGGVLSDTPGVYALERSRLAGIRTYTETPNPALPKAERQADLSNRILGIASALEAGLIILAGFLSILRGPILDAYAGRIINLHPSLLPKFGGMGMYGLRVHQAVLDAGERESGCTVHLADSGVDTGEILLQKRLPVAPGDTAETLAEKIHREEHIAIVDGAVLMINRLSAERSGA